jgi:hypothetical protein
MAFEELGRLEDQLDELQSKSVTTGDSVLRARIMTFAKAVYREMEVAFEGVDEILADISNARKRLSETFVSELLDKVDYSHSRKKFKVIPEVCDKLSELSNTYRADIDKVLNNTSGSYSDLFWLLEKHEGIFRRTIENAVRDIAQALLNYVVDGDIYEAQALANPSYSPNRHTLLILFAT